MLEAYFAQNVQEVLRAKLAFILNQVLGFFITLWIEMLQQAAYLFATETQPKVLTGHRSLHCCYLVIVKKL